ncbi:hypothetical protein B7486_10915 [cyanobacterium TDX16]|nr:hypothetical protein B7486_10915 [cyanobacterium TDX16]
MATVLLFLLTRLALAGDGRAEAVEPAPAWRAVFDTSEGWTGGDCAGTTALGDGRVVWLFGDSWVGLVREGKHADGSVMVNNAIAVHRIGADGAAPGKAEIEFCWGRADKDGKATAWVAPDEAARGDGQDKNLRYWPTGGGLVVEGADGGRRLYVFLMRIRDKDEADGVWNFEGCGSAVAIVENVKEAAREWRVGQRTLTRIAAGSGASVRRISWGVAAMMEDGDADGRRVLIYGVDSTDGLNKKLLAARARAEAVEQFREWRFWDGRGWSRSEKDAAAIADNVMDELTIHRVGGAGEARYVMIYSKPILDDHIVARTAATAMGPWTEPREIYRCPEPASDKRLMAYSAKAHPELSRPGRLLISYCVNSTDFFHMAGDASIYRPRFIEAPLATLRDPAGR